MNNYSFRVTWSEEDGGFIATCPEFPGLSAFGETRGEAIQEAEVALDLFIQQYEEEGESLPDPQELDEYSGQTRLRMPKQLHRALSEEADRQGVSLNTLLVTFLSIQLGRRERESELTKLLLGMQRKITAVLPEATKTKSKEDSESWTYPGGEHYQDPIVRNAKSSN